MQKMDEATLYKLNFHAPLHIGVHGVGYEETDEIVHSDTLFSAIMSVWGHFYDDDIEKLCKTPPFFISSAFPFKRDNLFFPRPMVKIGRQGEDDDQKGNKLKRVTYLSQHLFESIVKGEAENLEFTETETFQDGIFWCKDFSLNSQNVDRVFTEREMPRVTIDRHTNSSDIFYFSEIVFEKDAGLFFLTKFKEKKIKRRFEAVLRLLGGEGIGGDKRMGKGLYSLEIEEKFHLPIPSNADCFLTLSLYYPEETEFNNGILKDASYNLIPRKGWLHAQGAMSLRRREIRVFQEGSVFTSIGKDTYGTNPCVLEKNLELGLLHNIYRYGIAFSLPIKRNQSK